LPAAKRQLFVHGHAQARRTQRRAAARLGGLTQEALAEKSGFSQQFISDLERGKRNPTVVILYELATALEASLVELVTEGLLSNRSEGGCLYESSDRATILWRCDLVTELRRQSPQASATLR
jgi:transcriptional regulator with XRE-family HTH domain